MVRSLADRTFQLSREQGLAVRDAGQGLPAVHDAQLGRDAEADRLVGALAAEKHGCAAGEP